MRFKDSRKAIFLPVCEKLLCQYKGFVLNDEMRHDLKEKNVYYISKEFKEFEPRSSLGRIITIILLIPMLPFIVIGALIDALNNNERILTFIGNGFSLFFKLIFRTKGEISYRKIKKEKYDEVDEEDIPEFINHCHKYFAMVYVYSYTKLNSNDEQRVNELIKNGVIQGIQIIEKLSDLSIFIENENISIHNSFMVLLSDDTAELQEAKKLGFDESFLSKNIELWGKRNLSGKNSFRWNSKETLTSMKQYVLHYIYAKNNVYIDNKTVFYIEDYKDEFLNSYILKNYQSLCARFKEKGMHFIYFPDLINSFSNLSEETFSYLRLRIPFLYNLSDIEIKELIEAFLAKTDEESLYSTFISPLELPYFQRPCLLRSLHGGWADSKNRFTYKPLIYNTEDDLNILLDQYFKQLVIPDDNDGVKFRRESAPDGYDADYYFNDAALKNDPEFKEKIDQIKAQGNYGLMAEAIIYMLATLKNVEPVLLQKIQPLIDGKNLEEKSQVLSPIYIDKEYRIFLPLYGNREIKLHALSKSLYILFLKHPEGIRFKELYMFKDELMEIYAVISSKNDFDSMKKSIDDLVDCTNPSLNQKCSRIRQEILSIIDEPLAINYYIFGYRGEEKKVKIDSSYIHFE
jgi:hypothetical protein